MLTVVTLHLAVIMHNDDDSEVSEISIYCSLFSELSRVSDVLETAIVG